MAKIEAGKDRTGAHRVQSRRDAGQGFENLRPAGLRQRQRTGVQGRARPAGNRDRRPGAPGADRHQSGLQRLEFTSGDILVQGA